MHADIICTTPFTPTDVEKITNLMGIQKNEACALDQRIHQEHCQALLGQNTLADKWILIVEDNAINQVVIEGILEEIGLQNLLANNGQEAIDILNQEAAKLDKDPSHRSVDLILMDCQMPILDGYATTQKIRSGEASQHFCNIPIVALTANAMAGDREKCLDAGMDDYLTKPFETDNLLYTLKHYLSR